MLVFLPGQGEIRRVAEMLEARMRKPDVEIAPLYGEIDSARRTRRRAGTPGPRKVVLATSIAETTLTIKASGSWSTRLMRVPVTSPHGLTRLVTVRVSRGNADSAAAGPVGSSRACATDCGMRRRTAASSPMP